MFCFLRLLVLLTALQVVLSGTTSAQIPIGGVTDKIKNKIAAKQQAKATAQAEERRRAENAPLVGFTTGKRFALLVPVEDVVDAQIPRLPNLLQLAADLQRQLVQGGFSEENVEVIGARTDGQSTQITAQQSLQNIKAAISRFTQKAKPDDTLLVYLIGHGFGMPSDDPEQPFQSYFCAADTPPDAFGDRQIADERALPMQWLVKQLRDCSAAEKVLIVDACQTGTSKFTFSLDPAIETRGDLWVLASCRPGQAAYVRKFDGVPYPAFSWNFHQAISWAHAYDDDGDGFVTVREAFNVALRQTSEQRDSDLKVAGHDLEAAETQELRQQPRICVGTGLLPLVRLPMVLPASLAVSGSLEDEQRLTASTMARFASRLLQQAEEAYSRRLDSDQAKKETKPLPEDGYSLLTGYAVGGYLEDAQTFARDTRDATLFFARYYRSTGQYAKALQKFRTAGIAELEVFANGQIPPTELFFSTTSLQQDAPIPAQNTDKASEILDAALPARKLQLLLEQIGSVPVSETPGGPSVDSLSASTTLFISDVQQPVDSDVAWLKIARTEHGTAQHVGRWIKASDVHWCREASLLFIEGSDLKTEIASIIATQLRNSELLQQNPAFTAELQRLSAARSRLQRLKVILGRIQWTQQAAGWIQFAEGIVAMVENSKIRDVRNSYQRYQTSRTYDLTEKYGSTQNYVRRVFPVINR